jgi:hypothetical protein
MSCAVTRVSLVAQHVDFVNEHHSQFISTHVVSIVRAGTREMIRIRKNPANFCLRIAYALGQDLSSFEEEELNFDWHGAKRSAHLAFTACAYAFFCN